MKHPDEPLDVLGIGIGPFNLSLAALADGVDGVDGLRSMFVDQRPAFRWHPGLLLDDAMLQVSFLADLVSLADPTSRWSFLAYLQAHDRLLPFYLREKWRPTRREYDDYCAWVAASLPSCRFGLRATGLRWEPGPGAFAVTLHDDEGSTTEHVIARNVVLGVGTEPVVPDAFARILGKDVFHAAAYLDHRPALSGSGDVTVIGSGQSGAEIFLDLLRAQRHEGWALRWLTRSPAFAPMEQSPLGLEHFTPEYIDYFRALSSSTRDELLRAQWQLYKAISPDTMTAIYDELYERTVADASASVTMTPNVAVTGAVRVRDGIELRCAERLQRRETVVRTDAVVLATGFAARRPAFLAGLADAVMWDTAGRYQVGDDYRVLLDPTISGSLYVQNGELHCNGIGTPDLGLGAHRSAVILNSIVGQPVHRLPQRSAFTTFGVA